MKESQRFMGFDAGTFTALGMVCFGPPCAGRGCG